MKKILAYTRTNVTVIGLSLFVLLTLLMLWKEIGDILKYWTGIVGPTSYVLFVMAGMLVRLMLLIMLGKITDRSSMKELNLLEEGGPAIGLLGTVLGLVRGFGRMDLTASIDTSITTAISAIHESLYSTVIGLGIGLLAWFIKSLFVPEHLQDKKQIDDSKANHS